MTTPHSPWACEYLPYTAQHDGHEMPCYRIYPDDAPEEYIAETNEHLPEHVQRAHACLIAAAPQLLQTAENVVACWETGDLAEAVRELSAAIGEAKGRAP
jgi:hypothetical protein